MAISGPTSSGKSFMVQNYVVNLCKTSSEFKALYIVPTRALIAEASSQLRKRFVKEDVSIKVAVGQAEENNPKQILVLTPERCLQILRDKEKQGRINFIFMDEIQKVEDGERGVIYEYVLNELMHSETDAKIVLAGPYLKNLSKTMIQLTGEMGPTVESTLFPVYQLRTIFSLTKNQEYVVDVSIKNNLKDHLDFKLFCEVPLFDEFRAHPIPAMAKFVRIFGENSTNIIYAPTRRHAEKYALELAKLKQPIEMDEELKQLVDYLRTEIHKDYSLIRCLKKGVAFHHGNVPEIAKLEIEDIYRKKDGPIKNLSCTTTLLEGVNLPADRIFIHTPYKNNKNYPLNSFDFGNLIGRAGRVFAGLNGSVYCIQLAEEPWAEDKLASSPEKEIVPVTNTATSGDYKESLMANMEKPATEMNAHQEVVSTIIFLRQKAIRDPVALIDYLKTKNLSAEEVTQIALGIIKSVKDLNIAKDLKDVVRLNPTLDPILQNKLYEAICKDGWDQWLINKRPTLQYSGPENRYIPFLEKPFYYQFEEITDRLDVIFHFIKKVNSKKDENGNFKSWSTWSIARLAARWLEQAPMSFIIANEIKYQKSKKRIYRGKYETAKSYRKREGTLTDKTILQVSRHINNEIRFELVKYFKLWSDILNEILKRKLSEDERKEIGYNLSIPLMLELGAYDPRVMGLIRLGIDRSVAIEAADYLPDNIEGNVIDELLKEHVFYSLSDISQRHIIKLGFIPPKKKASITEIKKD